MYDLADPGQQILGIRHKMNLKQSTYFRKMQSGGKLGGKLGDGKWPVCVL